MKCTFPELCQWYHENENPKQPYCTLHDMKINYINIEIINNCKNHKTFKELKNNRTKVLDKKFT